jgi:hypothetical protein
MYSIRVFVSRGHPIYQMRVFSRYFRVSMEGKINLTIYAEYRVRVPKRLSRPIMIMMIMITML